MAAGDRFRVSRFVDGAPGEWLQDQRGRVREWWRRCRRWFRFVPLFVRGLFPVAGVSLVMAPGEGGAACSDLGGYSLIVRGRVAAWAGARVARGMFARDRRAGDR